MSQTAEAAPARPRWFKVLILLCATAVFVAMVSLGNWQMQRLAWKNDLIAQVDARAFGEAVAPPSGAVSAENDAYLRVAVKGRFDHALGQRVKAVTELGPGHWWLVPLQTETRTIWINRGFLPQGLRLTAVTRPDGEVAVTGLLRISEPGGTLLEENDPATGRWVSRDVNALSMATGVTDQAAFFIDADHAGVVTDWPRGGLTKVSFRNSHLSYALTWYAMALLFLGAMGFAVWDLLSNRAPKAKPASADTIVPFKR